MNFINPYDIIEIPILEFIRNLAVGLVLAVMFAWLVKKSTRLVVDTTQYMPLFLLLIPTMILIITVIKTSIALSLGLVGALLQLRLRIMPRAKKTTFGTRRGERWIVRVKSPPVDGKANVELIKFLADSFGCQRSAITLRQGETSRDKLIEIDRPTKIPSELPIDRS